MNDRVDQSRRARSKWPMLMALSLLAAAVATYLLWQSWQKLGLPIGCGEDAGCAEVLSSQWSNLLGVPVTALAIPLYLAVAATALAGPTALRISVLRFAAAGIFAAAIWFIGVQAVVLRAFCPWCLGEHALGIVIALLAWSAARQLETAAQVDGAPASVTSSAWWMGLLGAAGVGVMAVVQTVFPVMPTSLKLADQSALSESGSVVLLDGKLHVAGDVPRIGDAHAARTVYLLFDYCCPHCRRTHGYLMELMAEHPDAFNVVCLPMPRDADCNPDIVDTEERFQHACELAELALGVWLTDPTAFSEFDQWLFHPSRPPDPVAARAEAERRVDADRLKQRITAGRPQEHIRVNVTAYIQGQLEYLPVMMSPGMETIVGRPQSKEALGRILGIEETPSASPP